MFALAQDMAKSNPKPFTSCRLSLSVREKPTARLDPGTGDTVYDSHYRISDPVVEAAREEGLSYQRTANDLREGTMRFVREAPDAGQAPSLEVSMFNRVVLPAGAADRPEMRSEYRVPINTAGDAHFAYRLAEKVDVRGVPYRGRLVTKGDTWEIARDFDRLPVEDRFHAQARSSSTRSQSLSEQSSVESRPAAAAGRRVGRTAVARPRSRLANASALPDVGEIGRLVDERFIEACRSSEPILWDFEKPPARAQSSSASRATVATEHGRNGEGTEAVPAAREDLSPFARLALLSFDEPRGGSLQAPTVGSRTADLPDPAAILAPTPSAPQSARSLSSAARPALPPAGFGSPFRPS